MRLSIAIVHRGLRTFRGCSLEGVTLRVQRFGAGIRHGDFYFLPLHRVAAIRLRTPRTPIVTPVVDASTASVDPQRQPLFVESSGRSVQDVPATLSSIAFN